MAFIPQVVFAGIFEGGGSLVDDVAPSVAVSSQSRPLAMVNMAGTEGLLQRVFEALLWCPSVTVAGGKLAIQDYLGQAMIVHSGNMTCPA